MRERPCARLFGQLLGHLVIGAGPFSLTLFVSGVGHVFELITKSEAPKLTAVIFVGSSHQS
jgi:hypothetical protein